MSAPTRTAMSSSTRVRPAVRRSVDGGVGSLEFIAHLTSVLRFQQHVPDLSFTEAGGAGLHAVLTLEAVIDDNSVIAAAGTGCHYGAVRRPAGKVLLPEAFKHFLGRGYRARTDVTALVHAGIVREYGNDRCKSHAYDGERDDRFDYRQSAGAFHSISTIPPANTCSVRVLPLSSSSSSCGVSAVMRRELKHSCASDGVSPWNVTPSGSVKVSFPSAVQVPAGASGS